MATLQELNAKRWADCKVPADKAAQFKAAADKIMAGKSRYQAVEKLTGVPWWFIGVVHMRESNCNWKGVLHNGQAIVGTGKKTTIVPKGKGPFSTWEDAAVDALTNCAPFAAKNKDWTPGGALTMLEKYNGLGYSSKGIPSPYVWSGTNQYTVGKYIRDGVFSATTVDSQLGCAGILKFLGIFKTGSGGPVVAAGAVVAAGGGVASQVDPTNWPLIAGVTVGIGLTIWLIYSYIQFRRLQNVSVAE